MLLEFTMLEPQNERCYIHAFTIVAIREGLSETGDAVGPGTMIQYEGPRWAWVEQSVEVVAEMWKAAERHYEQRPPQTKT